MVLQGCAIAIHTFRFYVNNFSESFRQYCILFQESRESRLECVSNGKSRLSIKIFNYFTEHPLKRRATRRARAGSVRRQSSKTKRQGSVRSGSHSIGPGTTPGGKYIIQRSESLESNSCLVLNSSKKRIKNHYPEHLLFRKYS